MLLRSAKPRALRFEDLSVWIPKKKGADTPAGQRPFQLPITMRWFVGSALMDIIGPVINPMLPVNQAAKRGSSCGPNVATAFQHLESLGHLPSAAPGDLWQGILGEAADPCDAVCRECDDPALARMPAATLADQSKAFERLSLAWFVKVIHGWQMSLWVICAFLCFNSTDGVRAIIRGKPGLLRLLQCGLGMGARLPLSLESCL